MTTRMFRRMSAAVTVLAALAIVGVARAQEAYSPPVGFVKQSVQPHSDALVTAPLHRPPEFEGVIQSISGTVVTVNGTPAWTEDKFVYAPPTVPDNYYLLIASGTKEGMFCRITDNAASSVTVELQAGDDLAGIKTEQTDGAGNGDRIRIVPYWTPATIFSETPPNQTQLLLNSDAATGVNLGPDEILVIYGGVWYDSVYQPASDFMLHPTEAFVVRNNGDTAIDLVVVGSVPLAGHRSKILTLAPGIAQDNQIGYLSPVPEIIGNCSLGMQNGDQLLVMNNSQTGLNKGPQEILTYYGGSWYNSVYQDVTNTFQLQPAQGYIYRKTATTPSQIFLWQATQTYNQ